MSNCFITVVLSSTKKNQSTVRAEPGPIIWSRYRMGRQRKEVARALKKREGQGWIKRNLVHLRTYKENIGVEFCEQGQVVEDKLDNRSCRA